MVVKKPKKPVPVCTQCGRAAPEGLLYKTLEDITAHVNGRCPWCAWNLPRPPDDAAG